ncbi:MAG: hypothetical protein ACLFS9_11800 [Nitriliruptoraceae bacterium]
MLPLSRPRPVATLAAASFLAVLVALPGAAIAEPSRAAEPAAPAVGRSAGHPVTTSPPAPTLPDAAAPPGQEVLKGHRGSATHEHGSQDGADHPADDGERTSGDPADDSERTSGDADDDEPGRSSRGIIGEPGGTGIDGDQDANDASEDAGEDQAGNDAPGDVGGDQAPNENPANDDPANDDPANDDPANEDPANDDPANDDPADDDPADNNPADEEVDDTSGSDDTGRSDAAVDPVQPDPGAATQPSEGCTPALVTFTRDGTEGDAEAVALTSQALESGVAGWLHLSWQAAPDTDLTAVEVAHVDGSRSLLPAEATGTAYEVLALTFCGTTSEAAADGTVDGGATVPADGAEASDGPDAASTASQTPASAQDDRTREEPEAEPPVAGTTTSGSDGAAADVEPEEDVEVLGVQIVAPPRTPAPTEQDDEPEDVAESEPLLTASRPAATDDRTTGQQPLLLGAAVIAALIAGAIILRRRSLRAGTASSTATSEATDTASATPAASSTASATPATNSTAPTVATDTTSATLASNTTSTTATTHATDTTGPASKHGGPATTTPGGPT